MAYNAHGFRARAVHIDRPTLATAAYMDWSAELRRLHELRHGREVLLRWCQACEIQHFPPHFDRMPELPGVLPPVRVAACVAANCARCEAGRGGFQFPVDRGLLHPRLESPLVLTTSRRRKCYKPGPASRSTMWRRVTSTGWWPSWQSKKSVSIHAWPRQVIFLEAMAARRAPLEGASL